MMPDCPPTGANPERIEFFRTTAEQMRTEKVRGSIYIYLKDEWLDRRANPMLRPSGLTGGRSVDVHEVVHGEEVL